MISKGQLKEAFLDWLNGASEMSPDRNGEIRRLFGGLLDLSMPGSTDQTPVSEDIDTLFEDMVKQRDQYEASRRAERGKPLANSTFSADLSDSEEYEINIPHAKTGPRESSEFHDSLMGYSV